MGKIFVTEFSRDGSVGPTQKEREESKIMLRGSETALGIIFFVKVIHNNTSL